MSAPMNIHRRTPSAAYFPQPPLARSVSSQLGTSWSDGFDFTSRSPLTSALHLGTSPPMAAAHLPSSYSSMSALGLTTSLTTSGSSVSIPMSMAMSCSPGAVPADYTSFERDYCSNFACCGQTLPDMHALVAHFEEMHYNGAKDGLPFMFSGNSMTTTTPLSYPNSKPVQPIHNINSNGAHTNPIPSYDASMSLGPGTSDAPSPHSSVGPETPPPASHIPAYAYPQQNFHPSVAHAQAYGQQQQQQQQQPHPQLQVQTHVPPQIYTSAYSPSSTSGSPYPPFSAASTNGYSPYTAHSHYSVSPLSAGSPASSHSGSEPPEMEMEMDMDVLMHFDPLDTGLHTPLDSTPPSPLAPPVRPASVLRAAALKNSGAADAPPMGFPPSLFSAPALAEKEGILSGGIARKERRKGDKSVRGSRAGSPTVTFAPGTAGANESGAGTGGAVRREKARKPAGPMGSLLGLGAARGSVSSASGDEAPVVEEGGKEKESEEVGEVALTASVPERSVRAERAERSERSERGGKRTREKAYKCMKPGCTKSYLNPNGLKYHNAKGTCTFADGRTSDTAGSAPPTPITPSTPAIPSIQSSQSLSSQSEPNMQYATYPNAAGVPIIAAPVPRDSQGRMYAPETAYVQC